MLLIKPLGESLAKYGHRVGSRGPASAARPPGLVEFEPGPPGPRLSVVAGWLAPGPILEFRVPDRGEPHLYRVRVLEVAAGEGHRLLGPEAYRAAVAN